MINFPFPPPTRCTGGARHAGGDILPDGGHPSVDRGGTGVRCAALAQQAMRRASVATAQRGRAVNAPADCPLDESENAAEHLSPTSIFFTLKEFSALVGMAPNTVRDRLGKGLIRGKKAAGSGAFRSPRSSGCWAERGIVTARQVKQIPNIMSGGSSIIQPMGEPACLGSTFGIRRTDPVHRQQRENRR
jgi:hypothetical protein